jgi:hypothetical protein
MGRGDSTVYIAEFCGFMGISSGIFNQAQNTLATIHQAVNIMPHHRRR